MMKFLTAKKNKTPSLDDLHPKSLPPDFIWIAIIVVSLSFILFAALLSAFLSWKILRGDPFRSALNGEGSGKIIMIDKEKLVKAVDIINARLDSN